MRPTSTAPTFNDSPIFLGSPWLPLKRNTVLRAMTLRSGNCESGPIMLSGSPPLKCALPGWAVAFTNGRPAIEVTLPASDLARKRYTPAAPNTNNTRVAIPPITNLLHPLAVSAWAAGPPADPVGGAFVVNAPVADGPETGAATDTFDPDAP